MKTVMKELQEKITTLINDSKGDDTRTGDYRIGLHQALSLIDLEAEKEQIMEAFDKGRLDGVGLGSNTFTAYYETPEQYYQQTFKSDE